MQFFMTDQAEQGRTGTTVSHRFREAGSEATKAVDSQIARADVADKIPNDSEMGESHAALSLSPDHDDSRESRAFMKPLKNEPKLRDPHALQELRKKLLDKIEHMRKQRRAPGSGVPGAPKSREELLAARLLKKNKDSQKTTSKEGLREGEPAIEEKIIYGGVAFEDGLHLTNESGIQKIKRLARRNPKDQLTILRNQKKKLAQLSEDEKAKYKQNENWTRALLKVEGQSVRDDEKLLQRTIKKREAQKRKSKREWKYRIEEVSNNIAERQARRAANIKARIETKGMKGKALKRFQQKQRRAGFEGRKRTKSNLAPK